MVGARFPEPAAETAIEKADNDAVAVPSLTLITIADVVPTFAVVGVPESRPVDAENVAQAGMFCIENVSELPSGSEAAGWKL